MLGSRSLTSFSGSTSSDSTRSSSSPHSTSSLAEFPNVKLKKDAPSSLKLELASIELGLSTTTSRESLLDELLGDIRRSCATSLASTPTVVGSYSDGEEGENVFDCKLRRSEAELRTLSKWIHLLARSAALSNVCFCVVFCLYKGQQKPRCGLCAACQWMTVFSQGY